MSKISREYQKLSDSPQGETYLIEDGEMYKLSDGMVANLRKVIRSQFKMVMPVRSRSLKAILAEAFLATYGFDGYDPAKHEIATHEEDKKNYKTEELSWGLIIASFLGFPSRLPPERNGKFDIKTFFRGFIGGWIPRTRVFDEKIWNKKDQWQRAAIPVKLLLILPLKLITWPFKLFINIVKLLTEFLPKIVEISFGVVFLRLLTLSIEAAENQKSAKSLGWGILSAITFLFYLSGFLANFIGRLLTSPEKSARIFYYFIQTRTEKAVGKNWSILFGVILASISLLYSVTLWAIVFPLAIGFVTANFPIVLQAVAWVMQLPVVGPVLSFIQNVLMTIGSVTSSFLNLKAVTLFSHTMGLQISNTLLFLCSGIACVVAPIAILLTDLTDRFSNWWAVNVNVYNTEAVIWETVSKYQSSHNFSSSELSPGYELQETAVAKSSPRVTHEATEIVDGKNAAASDALGRQVSADAVLNRAARGEPLSQPQSRAVHPHVDTSVNALIEPK